MVYDYKIMEIKRIPLGDILIGKGQIRVRNIARGISELAESIRVMGQLQPIIVYESADQPGKFEILTGVRRFLACQEIGQKDIWAMILDRPVTEEEAKVISLTESATRQPLDRKDLIDALTHLYNLYGDIKAVAEKTGLPLAKIRDYVKYQSLNPELKKLVDSGSVDLSTALRAHKALEKTGEFKSDVAVALVKKMQVMTGALQVKVLKEVERGGITTIDEVDKITKAVKQGKTYVELRVKLDQDTIRALSKYALEAAMKPQDAIQYLITNALESMGYSGVER